jgi:hypothetical protein
MSEQTDQTAPMPGALPAQIELADIIEAVARGVARAHAAPDDVRGHAVMIGGLWFSEPGDDRRHPLPPNRVGVDGPTFNPPRLPGQPKP